MITIHPQTNSTLMLHSQFQLCWELLVAEVEYLFMGFGVRNYGASRLEGSNDDLGISSFIFSMIDYAAGNRASRLGKHHQKREVQKK